MKTISALVLALLIGTHAFAQSVKAPEDPVLSQISVTRDFTKMMNEKINREISDETLHASDYKEFQKHFRDELNVKFEMYEEQLQSQVLEPISKMRKQYESLMHSPYANGAIISQQLTLMDEKMEEYSRTYRSLLAPFYNMGRLPFDVKNSFTYEVDGSRGCHYSSKLIKKGNKEHSLSTVSLVVTTQDGAEIIMDQYCAWINRTGGGHYQTLRFGEINGPEIGDDDRNYPVQSWTDDDNDLLGVITNNYGLSRKIRSEIFQKVNYPFFRQYCRTQLCMGLVASEIFYFLKKFSTEVDKTLAFTVTGYTLYLRTNNKFKWDQYEKYAGRDDHWYLFFDALLSTAYPEEFKTLDFDTSN